MADVRGWTHGQSGPRVYTFLFSDIEGSTRLLQHLGGAFADALATHHGILRDVITAHGGVVRRTEGDSFFATFDTPSAALHAAVEAQRALVTHPWPDDAELHVRIGLHTGEAVVVANEFVGLDVHRAARIMSIGWGGQVLVSSTTRALLGDSLADARLEDLGEHRLKDLKQPERIYQVVAPGLRATFPALRTVDTVPNNLPAHVTSFVGREREVAEVRELLTRSRVVTLTGPGGTGKTRLSLRVAEVSADRYPDGVFFVALGSVTDPTLVMSTVATTLGLTPQGGRNPLELVTAHLEDAHALIVLDNFEQVLPAAVEISKLLADAPDVTALISSRAALHISGEHEYPVEPMPLPSGDPDVAALLDNDAAMLFAARAATVDPRFHINEENAAAVAQIINRLDGLPLAIELAAARAKLLPATAIAARLTDALDLLSGGARDVPDRQRTLRGAIAWSYDLLDEPMRRLFARCSVFRGGGDIEQLERVCGPDLGDDLLDVLGALVDHSLVRRVDAADVRFTMLETVREFAAERLEDSGAARDVRDRHAAAYLAVAEDAARFLTSDDSARWHDRLEREHDNLRAAIEHAVASGDAATALRLVSALWRMWQIRGHLIEGRRNAERVLRMPGVDDHPRELARAYEAAGGLAYWQGDLAGSRQPYERALELYRGLDDPECVARSTYNVAFTHAMGDAGRARELFDEALSAYEALADEVGVAKARWGVMVASMWSGDYEEMRRQGVLCLPVFRARGDAFDLAWALHMAGLAEHALGDLAAARSLFVEALDMFAAAGDASGIYLVLADFAMLAEATGDAERAMRLFGAVARLGDETGSSLLDFQLTTLPRRRRAEDDLDAGQVERLRAEGYDMSRDEAVAYATAG